MRNTIFFNASIAATAQSTRSISAVASTHSYEEVQITKLLLLLMFRLLLLLLLLLLRLFVATGASSLA
jgi:hypothetical protein